ncbi:MAG: hypothetical protein A3J06_00715 [Candidatus Moranbacteria bacterium RIFCSPLOWO2_02_FULL_48_19]|nr:MAG: hypothetical protein A3J06_00715 [Candidatus Moranbacteria bacterium RIFCSPLOWO2_02_FULL_48_19]
MSFYENQRRDALRNERVNCIACGRFAWGQEIDADGRCDAKGCRLVPFGIKQPEAKKAPVIQLVPREKTSPGSDKEQLVA